MKQFVHKTFSICMALLLMASTVSWTVGQHYCMGRLINVSLFEHAKDCGMDMAGFTETSISDEQTSCCNDELIVVEGLDDLKLSFEDISLDEQYFLVAYTLSYLQSFKDIEEEQVSQNHHPPPLLIKDIQLLDEVFLI